MFKGLKEAKATDMFNRAASGLGSSFYGAKEEKQKKTKKQRVYKTKQQQATNQTQATNQAPAQQNPANPPTQTPQNNTSQQENIDYVNLSSFITTKYKDLNNNNYIEFLDYVFKYIYNYDQKFESDYKSFKNDFEVLANDYRFQDDNSYRIVWYTSLTTFIYYYIISATLDSYKQNLDRNFILIKTDHNNNNNNNYNLMVKFIFKNCQYILDQIKQKAKEQSNNNQINESLIRRWKVLANIK